MNMSSNRDIYGRQFLPKDEKKIRNVCNDKRKIDMASQNTKLFHNSYCLKLGFELLCYEFDFKVKYRNIIMTYKEKVLI